MKALTLTLAALMVMSIGSAGVGSRCGPRGSCACRSWTPPCCSPRGPIDCAPSSTPRRSSHRPHETINVSTQRSR